MKEAKDGGPGSGRKPEGGKSAEQLRFEKYYPHGNYKDTKKDTIAGRNLINISNNPKRQERIEKIRFNDPSGKQGKPLTMKEYLPELEKVVPDEQPESISSAAPGDSGWPGRVV